MYSQPTARSTTTLSFASDLDALVAETMAEWKIPGLALAVVQSGDVALLKAYGYRDVEAELPVTINTHFSICSITKTFTSTGLALLVDQGRLDWTKPVREYIPEFRMLDPIATDRVTVRDLLCHHSGLPRHDWIWMPADLSPAEMLAAMRHLELSRDIREIYQYNNLGYNVAGIVTERISGLSWEDFIRTRLADNLHMKLSFTAEDLASTEDAAVPYTMNDDRRLRTRLWPICTPAAGGINTSIAGIMNWMRLQLGKGEFEGQQFLSSAMIREMHTPRAHAYPSEFAELTDAQYGLGFQCRSYRGERMVSHSGGWIGCGTLMALLPDRDIGVAVFTNRDESAVMEVLAFYSFDRLCGKDQVPWFDRFRERRRQFLAHMDVNRDAQKTARKIGTRPSHDLADYAGNYDHPGYGRIVITRAGDDLHWAYRGMSALLSHRHYDTFELPEIPGRLHPDRLAISFTTCRDGRIASLSAPFEPMVKDIVFIRCPAGDCTDAAFREACTGRFSDGPIVHFVTLDADGQLLLKPDFQPANRLRPYGDSTFENVEAKGVKVEFRRGENGRVDELVFHQPSGISLARRCEPDSSA